MEFLPNSCYFQQVVLILLHGVNGLEKKKNLNH